MVKLSLPEYQCASCGHKLVRQHKIGRHELMVRDGYTKYGREKMKVFVFCPICNYEGVNIKATQSANRMLQTEYRYQKRGWGCSCALREYR